MTFQTTMSEHPFVDPQSRRDILAAYNEQSNELGAEFVNRLYSFTTEGPPDYTTTRAQELVALLKELDVRAAGMRDEAMDALEEDAAVRHEEAQRLFADLRAEVVTCGLYSKDKVDEILAAECAPLVQLRHEEDQAVLARAAEVAQEHFAQILQVLEEVVAFLLHAAKMWTEHWHTLEGMHSGYAADKVTEVEKDKTTNAAGEDELDTLTNATRTAPDAETLKEALANMLEQLDVLEKGYRDHEKRAITLSADYKTALATELRRYEDEFCDFFLLKSPNADEEKEAAARAQAEQEEKDRLAADAAAAELERTGSRGGKRSKSKSPSRTKTPEKGKKKGKGKGKDKGKGKSSNKRGGKGNNAEDAAAAAAAARPATPPTPRVEDVDVVTSKTGKVYMVARDWDAPEPAPEPVYTEEQLAEMAEAEERAREEAEAAEKAAAKKAAKKGGSGSSKKGKTPEPEPEPEEEPKPEPEPEAEPELLVPAMSLHLPPSTVVNGVKASLRRHFVDHFGPHADVVVNNADQLTQVDVLKLNDELDDRLRLHRPRAGELEIQVYEQRLRELSGHRGTFDRHVLLMRQRLQKLQHVWKDRRAQFDTYCKAQMNKHEVNRKALFAGTNQDTLERLKRESRTIHKYTVDGTAALANKLLHAEAEDVAALKQANMLFLAPWKTFEEGGKVEQSELEAYREALASLNEQGDGICREHDQELAEVREEQGKVSEEYVTVLDEAYGVHLEDVQHMEKRGARISAGQNAVRLVITKSRQAEEVLAGKLELLRALMTEAPPNAVLKVKAIGARDHDEPASVAGTVEVPFAEETDPLVHRTLQTVSLLLEMRQLLLQRGVNIEALNEPIPEFEEFILQLAEQQANDGDSSSSVSYRKPVLDGAEEIEDEDPEAVDASAAGAGDGKKGGKQDKNKGGKKDGKKSKRDDNNKKSKKDDKKGKKGGKDDDGKKGKKKKGGVEEVEEEDETLFVGEVANCLNRMHANVMELVREYYTEKADREITRTAQIPPTADEYEERLRGIIETTREKATAHREDAVKAYRKQVQETSAVLLEGLPRVMAWIGDCARNEVVAKSKAVNKQYRDEYAALEEQRAANENDMRAGLQSVTHQKTRDKVMEREQQRQKRVEELRETRRTTLLAIERNMARRFLDAVEAVPVLLVQTQSEFITPAEVIPDPDYVPPAKSVKQMLKAELKAQRDEAADTREWGGVDPTVVTLATGEDGDDETAAEQRAQVAAGAVFRTALLRIARNPHNRALLKSRNSAYEAYATAQHAAVEKEKERGLK